MGSTGSNGGVYTWRQKIKGTANKNGLKNAMCKQSLKLDFSVAEEHRPNDFRRGTVKNWYRQNKHVNFLFASELEAEEKSCTHRAAHPLLQETEPTDLTSLS